MFRIAERRELFAPGSHLLSVDVSHECLRVSPGLKNHFSQRVEECRPAVILKFRIAPRSIDAQNIRLIFDRPGLQKTYPMLAARCRPIGDDNEQFRPMPYGGAKQFRETKVVANERRNPQALPFKHGRRISGLIMHVLTGERERLHFAISNKFHPIR